MILLRRVTGDSMNPTLKDGQLIVCHRVRKFIVGQVVVAFMNGREVVKRITKVDGGRIFLEGDNKDNSTDSRTHGSVVDSKIEGVVFWPSTKK
ncbi:MAG: phage repressor protein C with HTH and peptisase S24 domain [Candidatus Saccharimonadales bacterium]|jgi:phage repressor protein C with HTH and peptisase S24 domain